MMKHALYFILILCLLSCQSQDENRQAPPDPMATDTAATVQPPKPATPDSAYLIIPGESIGHIKLGMAAKTVSSILGKPDSGDAAMGKALSFWVSKQANEPQHYVAVYTVTDFGSEDETPRVQQVQVTSPQFLTTDSIGTGKSLPEIRQKYKKLKPLAYFRNEQQQQVYIYNDREQGIAFEITTSDSLCTAITIHPKGENVTDTYLPLHPDMTRLGRP
ncbi:hypothetical protein [Pontibacter anaerobius]|uniref:Lipoprotein n=1 Tax=Pontibacter anaerobius TaxID=2993940 RepID=A0ABT3RIP4_9BACT|nr:hypothetical protein [Pontibacter anaerobius]MCX2741420.1 hypothetical protein [Pontibacter anaerobius]